MKSFLLSKTTNKPTLKWGQVSHGMYFEGPIPEGYNLAICPHKPYVILDVDNKPGKVNGWKNIPDEILRELESSFGYPTNSGHHYWLKYTGHKHLKNKATKFGLDLRNFQGYVKFYKPGDIRDYIHEVKETSKELNVWLEDLFTSGKIKKLEDYEI